MTIRCFASEAAAGMPAMVAKYYYYPGIRSKWRLAQASPAGTAFGRSSVCPALHDGIVQPVALCSSAGQICGFRHRKGCACSARDAIARTRPATTFAKTAARLLESSVTSAITSADRPAAFAGNAVRRWYRHRQVLNHLRSVSSGRSALKAGNANASHYYSRTSEIPRV